MRTSITVLILLVSWFPGYLCPGQERGFEPALTRKENYPPWWELAQQAEEFWEQGKKVEAIQVWEKAWKLGYQDSRALSRLGFWYYDRGEYARAVTFLSRARPGVEQGAGEEEMLLPLYRALAQAQAKIGRRLEATINYRRALRQNPDDLETRLGFAELQMLEGKYLAAEKNCAAALKISPDHPRALSIQGQLAARSGDYTSAVKAYRQVLEVEPGWVQERFALSAALYYQLQDYPAAVRELERLLAIQGDHAPARALLAEIKLKQKDLIAARNQASLALELDPKSYNALVILGRLAWAEKQLELALDYYTRAYRLDPGGVAAEFGLGAVALEEGRLVEAEQRLRRCLRQEPELTEAAYHLGVVLVREGKLDEAETIFRELVVDHPGYAPGHLALGKLLLSQSKPQESLPYFLNAAALDRESWEARFFAGNSFQNLDQYNKALKEYERAFVLEPGNPAIPNGMALAFWKLGQTQKARQFFRQALELDPAYIRARINLAVLDASITASSEAAQDYRQAVIIRPGEVRWGYEEEPGELLKEISEGLSDHLATGIDYISLYQLVENLTETVSAIEELIPLIQSLAVKHPQEPGYPYLLGLCFQRQNRPAQAEHFFNRALQLNLDFAPAHLSLGRLFLLQSRPADARPHLEAFISLWPSGPSTDAARELLRSIDLSPADR